MNLSVLLVDTQLVMKQNAVVKVYFGNRCRYSILEYVLFLETLVGANLVEFVVLLVQLPSPSLREVPHREYLLRSERTILQTRSLIVRTIEVQPGWVLQEYTLSLPVG